MKPTEVLSLGHLEVSYNNELAIYEGIAECSLERVPTCGLEEVAEAALKTGCWPIPGLDPMVRSLDVVVLPHDIRVVIEFVSDVIVMNGWQEELLADIEHEFVD